MAGRLSSPMVTTVAPTMPVDAARSAPTAMTERPRQPRKGPKSGPMVSTSAPATRQRRSTKPKPPPQGPKERAHGFEQRLGDARALQHHAHEDEERNRDQHLVHHHAEITRGEAGEESEVENAQQMSDQAEDQRRSSQRECDRITDEHGENGQREHGQSEYFADRNPFHAAPPSCGMPRASAPPAWEKIPHARRARASCERPGPSLAARPARRR